MNVLRAMWAVLRRKMDIMRSCYVSRPEHRQEGHGHTEVPGWARLLLVWVGGPLFAFEQYYICWVWAERRGWPYWPGWVAYKLLHALTGWLERYGTPMQWNAPDSGMPNEVGFWTEATRGGEYERSPCRIFSYSSGGTTTIRCEGTGGADTVWINTAA